MTQCETNYYDNHLLCKTFLWLGLENKRLPQWRGPRTLFLITIEQKSLNWEPHRSLIQPIFDGLEIHVKDLETKIGSRARGILYIISILLSVPLRVREFALFMSGWFEVFFSILYLDMETKIGGRGRGIFYSISFSLSVL